MVDFLQTIVPALPDESDLMSTTRTETYSWSPAIQRQSHQSVCSYDEQQLVLTQLIESVDNFTSGNFSFIRHNIIVGPPGTGKSFLMFNTVAYALCKGLNCMITSLAAERSASVNGKHINALIPFPVEVSSTCDSLAKKALSNLQRDPTRSRYLEALDVLFIEEISMISSELWAAIDHVLQTICSNYVPFAGKLVIATGDFYQLPPPSGSSLISSSFPLTTFQFMKLKHFVRMQNMAGQELLTLIGDVPRSEAAIAKAWDILSNECNFVDSWDDVNVTDIRIFSTRRAEKEAVNKKIDDVKQSGATFESIDCIDEMCTSSANNWVEASDPIVRFLNRNSLEPNCLFLYDGAIMRLTVNMPDLQVFQGQLCVVVDISCLHINNSLKVALAPPGCRQIPTLSVVHSSWTVVTLRRATSPILKYNFRTTCRRTQFPLKLFVASTIHKTMGETLPQIATQIVGSSFYSLWMSEQLYVIASRVRDLADITFVGSRKDNEEAIKSVLTKHSHWASFTNAILRSVSLNTTVIPQNCTHPFPPTAIPPPNIAVGYSYLLQSAPQPQHLYVGSTMCLKRRLRQHNSGGGSQFTNVASRRPWILVAYVTGFPTSETPQLIKEFEGSWINQLKMKQKIEKQNVTVKQALEAGNDLVVAWRSTMSNLTLVVCST